MMPWWVLSPVDHATENPAIRTRPVIVRALLRLEASRQSAYRGTRDRRSSGVSGTRGASEESGTAQPFAHTLVKIQSRRTNWKIHIRKNSTKDPAMSQVVMNPVARSRPRGPIVVALLCQRHQCPAGS